MDGTFLGIYEKKVEGLKDKIASSTSEDEKKLYEDDLHDYLLKCLPYISSYTCYDDNPCENTVEIDPIFKSVKQNGIKRQQILVGYLKNVENKHDNSHDVELVKTDHVCTRCGSSALMEDVRSSDVICNQCGNCQQYIGEELTYKEEQESSEIVFNNAYKRDNHLNEWILQFQGKESTTIPPEVLTQLRIELKKEKIMDLKLITPTKIKTLLRKLRYSKYYEHATYIANSLTGIKPPVMSIQLDAKIRQMFREIQEPFERVCPANRSNFLSYSYVIYKFCELLEEDDYLPYFPLLKSKDKLKQQDDIWKNICKELQWQYIPTT